MVPRNWHSRRKSVSYQGAVRFLFHPVLFYGEAKPFQTAYRDASILSADNTEAAIINEHFPTALVSINSAPLQKLFLNVASKLVPCVALISPFLYWNFQQVLLAETSKVAQTRKSLHYSWNSILWKSKFNKQILTQMRQQREYGPAGKHSLSKGNCNLRPKGTRTRSQMQPEDLFTPSVPIYRATKHFITVFPIT